MPGYDIQAVAGGKDSIKRKRWERHVHFVSLITRYLMPVNSAGTTHSMNGLYSRGSLRVVNDGAMDSLDHQMEDRVMTID